MTNVGRCIVCGLFPDDRTDAPSVCRSTCAREAKDEAGRLAGRLHQLGQLTEWREQASSWEVIRRPAQRREAAVADAQVAGLTARQELLLAAVARWRADELAQLETDALAPRDVALAHDAIIASLTNGPRRIETAEGP